ncbi:hypothetical protein [Clostridium manihotivorum]|uniref:Copper amine oxidase-like N-terminal domain-containing protein n=1 Tax=Clostridium manihotivorum TaxID=2320868 RepID=A0A410DT73_9CLOT|nr:hypothetical protein [Clostridium manihotivorum]QAA32286.1 hypothetical protein C1I91_11910 [Clostridium manihotivorum]
MKKFDLRIIFMGALIIVLCGVIAFLTLDRKPVNNKDTDTNKSTEASKETSTNATAISSDGKIKSANFNNYKVYFNGKEIALNKPLVSIRSEKDSEPQLYMPFDEILKYMHFNIKVVEKNNAVYLTMGQKDQLDASEDLSKLSGNEADLTAADIIQKTGNWSYIEKYLKYMTNDGIKKVVDIYNSKHDNAAEHKNAADYMKK